MYSTAYTWGWDELHSKKKNVSFDGDIVLLSLECKRVFILWLDDGCLCGSRSMFSNVMSFVMSVLGNTVQLPPILQRNVV